MKRALGPLVVVAALAALFISRTGLVLHELGGHGGAAYVLGGRVVGWRLFVFGGGRVQPGFDAPLSTGGSLLFSLAGIILEIVVGSAALFCATRATKPLVRFVATSLGAAFVIHGLFYFVVGTHYGYGDGRIVHHLAGGARPFVVVLGTFAMAGATFAAGLAFARFIRAWIDSPDRKQRVLVFLAIVAVAGAVHGGLTFVEQKIVFDPTYAKIFRDEATERAMREVADQARLREMTPEEQERLLAMLAKRNQPFPLKPLLALVLPASILAGLLLRRDPKPMDHGAPIGWSSARAMAIATAAALVVVVLLREH